VKVLDKDLEVHAPAPDFLALVLQDNFRNTDSGRAPTTLNVGTTGPVDNLTYYHDSTMAIDANETGTYSIEVNNSTTLLMCLNFVVLM